MSPARRVLDPVDRASEILSGLIMVLTFTASLSARKRVEGTSGDADGALRCKCAWASRRG